MLSTISYLTLWKMKELEESEDKKERAEDESVASASNSGESTANISDRRLGPSQVNFDRVD